MNILFLHDPHRQSQYESGQLKAIPRGRTAARPAPGAWHRPGRYSELLNNKEPCFWVVAQVPQVGFILVARVPKESLVRNL